MRRLPPRRSSCQYRWLRVDVAPTRSFLEVILVGVVVLADDCVLVVQPCGVLVHHVAQTEIIHTDLGCSQTDGLEQAVRRLAGPIH